MQHSKLTGHVALSIAYIIFGLNIPISKSVFLHNEISGLALTFYRMLGAAILFWIVSLFSKKERVARKDLMLLFFAGMFGILINQMSFVVGLSMTSPIDASIIPTVVPLLTMVLAALFLKEPITWKKAIGVFMGAAGALLLILNSNTIGRGSASMTGNLLCMLSAVSFAVYLTAFKNLINRYSSITLMKWMFLFAAAGCTPFCWNDVYAVNYATLPVDIYIRIGYIVIMATFISYMLLPIGQQSLRPTIVSMYNYVQPIVSSLVSIVLGMDIFGWKKGGAALLVFLGVYLVTQSKSRIQLEKERINHEKSGSN